MTTQNAPQNEIKLTALTAEDNAQDVSDLDVDDGSDTPVSGAALSQDILDQLNAVDAEDAVDEPEQETSRSAYLTTDSELCIVAPRLLFTFNVTDDSMAESHAELKAGLASYDNGDSKSNLYNVLAKGKDDSAQGALRAALTDILSAANLLATQPIVIMGDSVAAVSSIQENLNDRISTAIVNAYTSGEEEITLSVGETETQIDLSDLVRVTSWVSNAEDDNGSVKVFITTNVSINMPMLYNSGASKPLYDIIRTIISVVRSNSKHYAATVDSAVAVAIGDEMLASAEVRTLLNDLFTVTDETSGENVFVASSIRDVHYQTFKSPLAEDFLSSVDSCPLYGAESFVEAVFPHGGALTFITKL